MSDSEERRRCDERDCKRFDDEYCKVDECDCQCHSLWRDQGNYYDWASDSQLKTYKNLNL